MSEENNDLENNEDAPKTYTQEEVDNLVKGLKANNAELLSEKKAAQEVERKAQQEAQALKEKEALNNGKYEELLTMQKERNALETKELKDQLKSMQDSILGERKELKVNESLNYFVEDSKFLGKSTLNSLVETAFNEAGSPTTIYKDLNGNVLSYDNPQVFKQYLESVPELQKHLKGNQYDGGGHRQENNSGAVSKKPLTKTELTQLANNDPVAYQQYIKKGK